MKYILLFLIPCIVGFFLLTMVFFQMRKDTPIAEIPQNQDNPISTSYIKKNPPAESMIGTVTTLSGLVEWESREATAPSQIQQLTTLQQGERLVTKEEGEVTVHFPNTGIFTINEYTDLTVIQSLPQNLVLLQRSGSALYEQNGTIPLTVRSLNSIIDLRNGTMSIEVNPDTRTIALTVLTGTATMAFNNVSYVSQVYEVKQGNSVLYDDASRTVEIESL